MQVTYHQISLTAAPQSIMTGFAAIYGAALATQVQTFGVCKLQLKLAPAATGPFRIQPTADVTNYSATAPGDFIGPWPTPRLLEDMEGSNSIMPLQYAVSGANPGDRLNVEFHVR